MSLPVEVGATAPLVLTVDREGAGAVTGLTPSVALRNGSGEYLDWADHTFKPSGWAERKRTLLERGDGHYATPLNLLLVPLTPGAEYMAEYDTESTMYPGVAQEEVIVLRDTNFLRKMSTNRMEQTSGNPGQLTLFDDDGVTPLRSWPVRDEFGGGIASQVGVPARRGPSS